MLGNKNTLKVYGIFFGGGTLWENSERESKGFIKEWLTLKEASKIFNPNMSKNARNERIVQYNFSKFNKLNWLDVREEKRRYIKTSKLGKKINIIYPIKTYRANYNFFFESKIDTELKEFLLFFLNQSFTRHYLEESYKEDIPSGVEEIVKQLFLIAITLKKYGFKKRYNINLENYKEVIHGKIQEYYSDVLYSKEKGKRFSKLLKKLYPQNSFWTFSELFAFAMIKLFFKERIIKPQKNWKEEQIKEYPNFRNQILKMKAITKTNFATELAKTSPKLYLWLLNMYKDFTFGN